MQEHLRVPGQHNAGDEEDNGDRQDGLQYPGDDARAPGIQVRKLTHRLCGRMHAWLHQHTMTSTESAENRLGGA